MWLRVVSSREKRLDDVKYNMKDFLEEWKKQVAIVQAEELKKLEASPNNPGTRITPDMITRLALTRFLSLVLMRKGFIMAELLKWLMRGLVLSLVKETVYRE